MRQTVNRGKHEDRQAGRHGVAESETDRQTDTEWQNQRQTRSGRIRDRQADRHGVTESETDRQTDTE